jgi:hypothetical protein
MRKSLLRGILLVLLASCRSSTSLDPAKQAEIAAAAKQALKNYYDDLRAAGLLAEFKWLDSSASFFWIPPGYASPINFDSVAKIIRSNSLAIKSIDENWEELHIHTLSDEIVSYSGRLHSLTIDTAGNKHSTRLVETGILVKRAAGWKLLCGQTNILPGNFSGQ